MLKSKSRQKKLDIISLIANAKPWSVGLSCAGLIFVLALIGHNGFLISLVFSLFGFALGAFMPRLCKNKIKKNESRLIDLDLPDYLTTVALLIRSGLTIFDALRRALTGFDANRPLFREIHTAFDEIDKGKAHSEIEAFEHIYERIESPKINTFVSAVVQNYRKGSDDIATIFTNLAELCRSERRILVSKMADEATTLLLIPSTIVLLALIVMLVSPAILELLNF